MIYSIQDYGFDFQRLDLMLDDVIDARPEDVAEDDVLDFCQTNIRLAAWWPLPETQFISEGGDESAPIPDISKWIDASLVLSPKAYRYLGELLKSWGELLPVKVGEDTFYIFNCSTFGEVDESQSEKEYYEGAVVGIKKLVFNADDVTERLVFKTPFNSCIEIYCGERFHALVGEFGLSGLDFVSI